MTSEEEKIEGLIDELRDLAVSLDGPFNRGYIDEITGELFKTIRSALHSVEAERPKPVGRFYNRPREGRVGVEWCCDHLDDGSALYAEPVGVEAEKEPEWISCEDRLPTEKDGDCDLCVWAFNPRRGVASKIKPDSVGGVNFTHWMPTGLVRPAPPEHKPE